MSDWKVWLDTVMNKKIIEDNMQQLLFDLSQQFSIAIDTNIKQQLSAEIVAEKTKLYRYLILENPLQDYEIALKKSENELAKGIATIESLEKDFDYFRRLANQVGSRIDSKYWLNQLDLYKVDPKLQELSQKYNSSSRTNRQKKPKNNNEDRHIFRDTLLQQWRKLLDQSIAQWEIEELEKHRRALWHRLQEWLEILQIFTNILQELSIGSGLLFDLSKSPLSLSNLQQLKRWADYISNDQGVKELCDILGRLRYAEKSKRQELVKSVSTVLDYVPDISSKEEIIGVQLGRDIENALPQEIALLSDDETALLFDLKFIENRLMCFEMQGMQINSYKVEEAVMTDIDYEEKLGPIIICVDTSGSMHGSPENIAKAITLVMAARAISQKRNCFLINFSTSIETLDLSGNIGISKVIEFLQRSFHGGTDVGPAITYALKLMEDENYSKSDLLIISDFIMASLPDSLQENILQAKENENQFYSLAIGDMFLSQKLKKIFDKEWIYNPAKSSIHAIQDIVTSI